MKRMIVLVFILITLPLQADTVLVGTFFNGNNGALQSRAYIWNPSQADAAITASAYTLPLSGPSTLLGTVNLGLLNARSGRNIKIAEDILAPLNVTLPYIADGGNLMVEFTVGTDNARGTGQVFASDLAFGTYPLEVMPSSSEDPGTDPPPPSGTAKLALLSTSDDLSQGGSLVTVQGLVMNISNETLDDVQAEVTWFTQGDAFITSTDDLIELNPLLPGQTSSFSVTNFRDSTMSKFTVGFKELFGGSIPSEDRR